MCNFSPLLTLSFSSILSWQADFNGRSDYGPFIENGIPAGGLETGAEVIKTAEERTMFGGLAGMCHFCDC